jgi:uncharacterized membrane protein YdjX (TVP38/TMEM64 family)
VRLKSHKFIKPVIAIVAIALLMISFRAFNVQELLRTMLTWVNEQGNTGTAIYCVIYVLACVFLVPGSILTLGAGVLFGVVKGSIIVSIASTTGATAAFIAGRYLARKWVASKVDGNTRFKAIDEAVADEGWKIVGLTRLSPVFPFNLLNYAFGLTKVSIKDYIIASWIGMMPGTIMYVYMGSLAGDLASIGATSDNGKSSLQWGLTITGFIATIVVTVLITKIAKKSLSTRMDIDKNNG